VIRGHFPLFAVAAGASPERYATLAHNFNALFSGFFLGSWLYIYLGIDAVIYTIACVPQLRRWLRSRRAGAPLHLSTVP
jgi:hypothetical protein